MLFFSKTSPPTPLPLSSSQTPRRRLEKDGALAEPWKKEVKTGIKKIGIGRIWKSAVYEEMSVCGCLSADPDSTMSYFHKSDTWAKWKKESCWKMKIEIINLMTSRSCPFVPFKVVFMQCQRTIVSFKISIIYHQLKFVVYVQVYLYTPKLSGEHKSGSSN